jgi:hypothetical protein
VGVREKQLAILRELESFLLELGAGFSFVARQKRIQIDGEDFYRKGQLAADLQSQGAWSFDESWQNLVSAIESKGE